jgi:predicted dehydrogenase
MIQRMKNPARMACSPRLNFLILLWLACAAVVVENPAMAQTNSPSARFQLITVDPGHFHAALVQKFMYPDVDPLVPVYAPAGDDLREHLKRIVGFNTRTNDPDHWIEQVYTGADFFDKMLADKPGNIVVLAGNNARKTDYILRSVQAGFNVLADKPMVITPADLPKLRQAFAVAASNHVLLYDIMTERYEITTVLQRELSRRAALFGDLVDGSPDAPAIEMEGVHNFSKIVAGVALKRPAWAFDVRQQGEGIVDVTSHLVDLVQWAGFPDQALKPEDVTVLNARRWNTPITREQFKQVTGLDDFPASLAGDVKNGVLQVSANGEFSYKLRNVHASVSVVWNFGPGDGDTHHSIMRGTMCNLVIRQGEAENFKPVLYVEKNGRGAAIDFVLALQTAIQDLQAKYPGIGVQGEGPSWRVTIPDKYDVGHEAHFSQVTENYLNYLRNGRLPNWEVPDMLTKYATLMQAYEMSR